MRSIKGALERQLKDVKRLDLGKALALTIDQKMSCDV